MYRLASNVQIGLKCTDWPQMYRLASNVQIGFKCTELASNVLCLKCTVPQMYKLASNVQNWPQMYRMGSNVLPQMYCASNVQIGLKCTD